MTPAAAGAASTDSPPLSSRVWRVVLRNEWFKARKRLAFWLTLGFFAFITAMEHGEEIFDDESTFNLPEAWSEIFSGDSIILLIFASIALIMLASSEFSWRTARQNVIDGLSKTQWFWGKAMLLPLLGTVFLVVKVGIAGVLATIGTDFAAASGPLLPFSVLAAIAGLFLAFLNVGGLALLLSTTIRSAGPAMAAWFFWIAFGEQLLPALLGRLFPSLQTVLGYLPLAASNGLMRFAAYDAAAYERMVAAAEAAERAVPVLPHLGIVIAVNAGWALTFLAVSFVWFRRRDL